jgi:DNA-binding NtrC family response regulator
MCAKTGQTVSGEVLIIDDKPLFCRSLAENLVQVGYTCRYATSGREGVELISRESIQVVLLDIVLGEEDGIEVLKRIREHNDDLPVIMITGYATVDTAVESMKIGAFDYIQKPLNFNQLLKVLESALEVNGSSERRKEQSSDQEKKIRVLSRNHHMLELYKKIEKLAATDLPILIYGQNGTGKEVMADYIHAHSSRRDKKMIKVNCAAFPENLLDNELFGHEKGAYTSADARFIGLFEKAHQGTLFLDEIGDMSAAIQSKILRALQNKEIRRIGGTDTIQIDVRFIAATNKDLITLMNTGKFREDLYYRLNTAFLNIIPLRERKEDIQLLVDCFLEEFSKTRGKSVLNPTLFRLEPA